MGRSHVLCGNRLIERKAEEGKDKRTPHQGDNIDRQTKPTQVPRPVLDGLVLASIKKMKTKWKYIREHIQSHDSAEDAVKCR